MEKRKALNDFSMITSSGTSNNEDFSRYFGQEKGLNNYIKLPINLTLQKNQTGEFTDITYIFLAFVPVVLLFFRSRKEKIWQIGMIGFLLLGILSFFHIIFPASGISLSLSNILAKISLPAGYLILLALVFGFLFFADKFLAEKNKESTGIIVLTGFYGILFWISAFGVVWYGVTIYFLFLVIIALGLQNLNISEEKSDGTNKNLIIFFLIAISFYLAGSAQIHAFYNLTQAGYNEYKYRILPQNTSIFLYKPEYFQNILELNISDAEYIKNQMLEKIQNSSILKTAFQNNFSNPEKTSIYNIHSWLQRNLSQLLQQNTSETQAIKTEIINVLELIYSEILYPKKDIENTANIYRIGTFMTYFIHKNRSRYYEDSLIQNFQTYFYEEDIDQTIENMKKMGIKYLLVDLNAATIDSGEYRLTKRYENLLHTLSSEKLSLINTDNYCLRLALDEYHNKNISYDDYLKIAGTNYI